MRDSKVPLAPEVFGTDSDSVAYLSHSQSMAPRDCSCHTEATIEGDSTIRYLLRVWKDVPPHVRDAILTLIDASIGQRGNGGQA